MIAAARRFAVGCYTPDGAGPAVHLVERDAEGGWRVTASAVASNPSFLAVAGDVWFAVGEDAAGSVVSFRLEEGGGAADDAPALVPVASVVHGEADPCHVVVAAEHGVLLVANYTGGSVTAVPFAASGDLGRPVTLALPHRTGPVFDRQDAPHAHQVAATPWGTHLVSDLGGDEIHELVVERATDAATPALRIVRTLELPPGTGPRHMLVGGGLLHVVGELDGRLHTFVLDAASFAPSGSEPVVADPGGDVVVQPSHLDRAPSGRLLTALVRGRDTVSVFEATDAARPRLASELPIGAEWPRHHAHLDDRTVVVAAQEGDALVELDLVTGAARKVLALRAPACVVPLS
ncbi:lactonase family protein [Agromyces bracchium]|uniref:Beta-propeller fold lactonase family protein n=1 Tax=Agromyces bracchium TaxID=88376 RepID=A0A6I3M3G3_9MICO|nr:beta-propeller fold lactonase family protein [Agromyces bracchium]MTH67815.1 beta-propeller fold lactonase family protein [Agromyces bracchium]